jgi:hypothetical protein
MLTKLPCAAVIATMVLHGCATTTYRRVVSPAATDPVASTACLQRCTDTNCLDACPDLVVQKGRCADIGLVAIDRLPGDRLPGTEDRRCLENSETRAWFQVTMAALVLVVLLGAVLYNGWGSSPPSHG